MELLSRRTVLQSALTAMFSSVAAAIGSEQGANKLHIADLFANEEQPAAPALACFPRSMRLTSGPVSVHAHPERGSQLLLVEIQELPAYLVPTHLVPDVTDHPADPRRIAWDLQQEIQKEETEIIEQLSQVFGPISVGLECTPSMAESLQENVAALNILIRNIPERREQLKRALAMPFTARERDAHAMEGMLLRSMETEEARLRLCVSQLGPLLRLALENRIRIVPLRASWREEAEPQPKSRTLGDEWERSNRARLARITHALEAPSRDTLKTGMIVLCGSHWEGFPGADTDPPEALRMWNEQQRHRSYSYVSLTTHWAAFGQKHLVSSALPRPAPARQ